MKKMNLLAGSLIARAAACAVCAAFIALAGCSGGSGGGSGSSDLWEEPESPGSPQNPADPGSPDVPEEPLPPGAVTYTVTFIANAPEGESASGEMDPQVFAEGQERVLSANAFSVAGYTFKGWAEVDSAEEPLYTDRQQVLISADTQLYAVWGKADAENPDAPSSDGLSVDGDGNLVVEDAAVVKPDVRIPDGVKMIGVKVGAESDIFYKIYSSFKSITIPASVEKIEKDVFTNNVNDFFGIIAPGKRTDSLPFKFIVDEKNQHFKTNASGNMLLSKDGTILYFVTNSSDDFTIPATVTEIADAAFHGANIKNIKLSNMKIHNNSGVFEYCTKLETAELVNVVSATNDSPTDLWVYDFNGCINLLNVDLRESGITELAYTFWGCSELKEVYLPKTLVSFDNDKSAFRDCKKLERVTKPRDINLDYLPAGITIGDY